MATLTYRPEIDGLRAVAVLAIVAFHLDPRLCPGGFIGVDVFFVISGFVITRQITANAFSFRTFYTRRAYRLLPALIVTILATLLAGSLQFGPRAFANLAASSLWSLAGAANLYFWWTIDYFNPAGRSLPLLHLWSLGVEEQFYLIWPALLVILQANKARLGAAVAIFCGSLAAALVVQVWSPESAFYLTPFRIFAFAAGAAVALAPPSQMLLFDAWRIPIGVTGGLMLAYALAFLSEDMAWPSSSALLPVVATVLLIAAGRDSPTGSMLCLPLMRSIGRASYALYLVHWPIVVFARGQALADPTAVEIAGLAALTFVAGYALHHLVERPFRLASAEPKHLLGVRITRRGSLVGTAAGALLVVTCTSIVIATAGLPFRSAKGHTQQATDKLDFAGDMCDARKMRCDFGDAAARRTVYLVGDSHALNLIHGLDQVFRAERIKGIALFDHGCLMLADTVTFVGGVVDRRCRRNVEDAFAHLGRTDAPLILVNDYASYRDVSIVSGIGAMERRSDDAYAGWLRQRLTATLVALKAEQRKVILLRQSYATGIDMNARYAHLDRVLAEIAATAPTVTLIDPRQAFCATGVCTLDEGGKVFFRDTAHLTTAGSDFLIRRLEQQLLSALRP